MISKVLLFLLNFILSCYAGWILVIARKSKKINLKQTYIVGVAIGIIMIVSLILIDIAYFLLN